MRYEDVKVGEFYLILKVPQIFFHRVSVGEVRKVTQKGCKLVYFGDALEDLRFDIFDHELIDGKAKIVPATNLHKILYGVPERHGVEKC